MPRYVLANVRDQGYATPTPIQMQTIPLMMHVMTLFNLYSESVTDVPPFRDEKCWLVHQLDLEKRLPTFYLLLLN